MKPMTRSITTLSYKLALVVAMSLMAGNISARTNLLHSSTPISHNPENNVDESPNNAMKNLLDDNINSSWHSGANLNSDSYIQVKLDSPVSLGTDEDLIFTIARCNQHEFMHPTHFLLEGSTDGSSWEKVCNIFYLYRGKGTREFSHRIHPAKSYQYFRLTVKANNSRTTHDGTPTGHRLMGLAELQIIRLSKDEYPGYGFRDNLHLLSDYDKHYQNYDFEYTNGFLHPANHQYSERAPRWCDWSKWVDGKWTGDASLLEKAGIRMPEFTMVTNADKESPVNRVLKAGEERQPSYTSEHILYAIPGDVVTLYPYYEMPRTARDSYMVNYAHWYDWTNGGHITAPYYDGTTGSVLDFALDPSGIVYSDKSGYFGGHGFWKYQTTGVITISSPSDWIEFALRVNKGETKLNAIIAADLDFSGFDAVEALGIGKNAGYAYCGKIDGCGHTIKNLVIKTSAANNGFVKYAGDGFELRNLNFDSTCTFEASQSLGLIGNLNLTTSGVATISNINSQATIVGNTTNGEAIAGLIGNATASGVLTIENCIIGGKVTKSVANPSTKKNAAILGWITPSSSDHVVLKNIVVSAQVDYYASTYRLYVQAQPMSGFAPTNCWGPAADWNFKKIPADINTTTFAGNFSGNFEVKDGKLTPILYSGMDMGEVTMLPQPSPFNTSTVKWPDANYATVATFFYPRDPFNYNTKIENLPTPAGNNEYVIAADFSSSFKTDSNLTDDNKIIEPIIHFRHIFRVRDGVAQADELSASKADNEEYQRKNRISVSAREGVSFHVRMESPVPTKSNITTPSKYYYKTSDGEYRRICTMEIHVYEALSGQEVTDQTEFKFDCDFEGQGYRTIDGVRYSLCGGDGRYYRMLLWDNPHPVTVTVTNKDGVAQEVQSENFIVRITGNDVNGNPITFSDGSLLTVMEYEIHFKNENEASFVLESELYDYSTNKYINARPEVIAGKMNTVLGSKVDFDEYRALEHTFTAGSNVEGGSNYLMSGGTDKFWYKWPLPWKDTQYSFAYDYAYNTDRNLRYDYNEYLLASHCDVTPWHGAAGRYGIDDKYVKEGEIGNENDENYEKGQGLYDRRFYDTRRHGLTDPSVKPEHGYFYYINAATDPGVMARLAVDDLCLGSVVHVSAWIAEFSKSFYYKNGEVDPTHPGETANVVFHFVAVLGDHAGERKGERVKMHSFVSGYVPWGVNDKDFTYVGHWMHLYYSFIPNFADLTLSRDDIDHFELELDNNAKSSVGADYAVDEIAMYIENPTIEAKQMSKLCDDDTKTITVKVEADYEVLLQSLNIDEGTINDNEDVDIFYTFIDKEEFDKLYAEKSDDGGRWAYEGDGTSEHPGAVVRYPYDGGETPTTYGTLKFNSCFINNEQYDFKIDGDYINVARRDVDEDGTRKIVFNTVPTDDDLHAEKKYYVALSLRTRHNSQDEEDDTYEGVEPDWNVFNITELCTLQCQFKVQGASVTKLDGKITERDDEVRFCEGQSPVVQVNLAGINPSTGEIEIVEKNAYFDWYDGPYSDYINEKSDSGVFLSEAIDKLRALYPLADDMLLVEADEDAGLTQDIVDYLLDISTTIRPGEQIPRLRLHQRSFVFPPLTLPIGVTEGECSILAIPIVYHYMTGEDLSTGIEKNYLICSEPTIVTIKVMEAAPELRHGLSRGITYPDYLLDVPLRVSLDQISKAAAPEKSDLAVHPYQLNIPVRKVEATGLTDADSMRVVHVDAEYDEYGTLIRDAYLSDEISLVYTDDPEYKDLGSPDYTGEEIHLLHIGQLTGLTAKEGGEENAFRVVFYDTFKFKEGYTYRMRFPFEEDSEKRNTTCPGQDIFTIKIVPEYMAFTGDVNQNFNNDRNWRRVSSEEVYFDDIKDNPYRYERFSDGLNKGSKSFAPLDFTKILIPGGKDEYIPHLSELPEDDLSQYFTDIAGKTLWPSEIKDETCEDMKYDMVGYNPTANGVECRPWYAYTCEQVHFLPKSEILGQEYLRYNRAWVDLQINAQRWYTLSMPLQEVFAGDMYLPTEGARQRTEMFKGIEFNTDEYDRFRPAVYQRGWDKSSAIVYQLGDPSAHNVAVKAAWSNVYNDVEVKYGAGTGFSIKTDASQASNAGADVIFRLPKDDTFFEYYEKGNANKGHYTDIVRDAAAHYRLNPVDSTLSAIAAPGSKFFLVGNPFMAKMDMAKFFEANKEKILPKYWLISEEGQQFGVFDTAEGSFVGTASDVIAPMQGFFVEAIAPATTPDGQNALLELSYDKSMIYGEAISKSLQICKHYGNDASQRRYNSITIHATSPLAPSSTAILRIDADAKEGFDPARDVELLDNSAMLDAPLLYVISGDMAASYATRREIEGTQLGVVSPGEQRITLTFDGVEDIDSDLFLYNASTAEMLPLSSEMEYVVTAPVSNLFITRGEMPEVVSNISYRTEGNTLTVLTGTTEPTDIAIYDLTGNKIAGEEVRADKASYTLCTGIYLLRAENAHDVLTAKILIK